ncbi:hypothetical protein NXY46_00975 [Bacteroides ovatus]|nr:hypothetical protein [Bacteroides ovatus]
MKKIYSLLIATFFLLVACEKDEIQMWDSGNYVQFMEEYKDSLTYSFFLLWDTRGNKGASQYTIDRITVGK